MKIKLWSKAAPILSHYCSIITRLVCIYSHIDFLMFVSCLAFVCSLDYPQGFLLSGSGDSRVCLWDFTSGSLHDTCEVGAKFYFNRFMKTGLVESNGREEIIFYLKELTNYIIALVLLTYVFFFHYSLHEVMLLSCDLSARTLSVAKAFSKATICIAPAKNWTPTAHGGKTRNLLGPRTCCYWSFYFLMIHTNINNSHVCCHFGIPKNVVPT
ncbi:hypothetical protein HHK36_012667 [Tetracentron sinense]|uniref:Uncharacterized protein n=1 Tax=Tetracentron sinense TaxID=13715 RepID=A0A834ZDC3_TETSI|nr:hypothetical protein HHK36_012667 [Tetracentron sinense]